MFVRAKEIFSRINGISGPLGGVQWTPPPPDRQTLRKFIVFLQDRRALFNPIPAEVEDHVINSIQRIREECVTTLGELSEKSPAAANVRAIGAACRRFLDHPYPDFNDISELRRRERDERGHGFRRGTNPEAFFTALGEFRGLVGAHIAVMAAAYDIDVDGDLASILPPPVDY